MFLISIKNDNLSISPCDLSALLPNQDDLDIGESLGIDLNRANQDELRVKIGDEVLEMTQSNGGLISISTIVWDAALLLIDFLQTVTSKDSEVMSIICPGHTQLGRVLDIGCGTGS